MSLSLSEVQGQPGYKAWRIKHLCSKLLHEPMGSGRNPWRSVRRGP